MWPFRSDSAHYSNCLIWALRQRVRYGGRLLFFPSPHHRFLFRTVWQTRDGRCWYFGPLFPRRRFLAAFFHKMWFSGEVRECGPDGKQIVRRRCE